MASYRIYMRAADYSRLGELDTYQSFKAVLRFNDVGTWSLTAPYNARNARIITESGGIVVTRDGAVVFSGPTATLRRTAGGLEATGFDDMVILADNPAYPTPTEAGPTFSDESDVRTGIPSTLMIDYVRANIGPAAVAGTYVSELGYAADPYLGTSGTARARFVPLLQLLQNIAWSPQGGGLRFSILQNEIGSAALTFTVSQPLDRRNNVLVNRERGTLGAFTASYKAPSATHILMLGQGVGPDRMMATATNAAAEQMLGRRIVKVFDRRDIEDPAELQQAADAELLNCGMQRSIVIEPLATSAVIWGRDYDLGDIVTVSAGDLVMDEVVRGVELTLEAPSGKATVQPIISSPQGAEDDPDGVAARQFRFLDERVSNMERNVRAPLDGSLSGGMLASGAAASNIGAGEITGGMIAASERWNYGDIRPTARSSAATGWLLCQGQVLSQTTYANLYAAIGSTFNTGGEGGGNFRNPDLRGRFPMGASGSHALGSSGGAESFNSLHHHAMPHDHGGTTDPSGDLESGPLHPSGAVSSDGHTHPIPEETGDTEDTGDAAQSVLNPFQAINYEIYTGV